MKKLSIVIATYNRSQSLLRILRSVVGQTAPAQLWECVVVNNNSTDDTEAVFSDFAEKNPTFDLRMVTETKQGLSNARNCGIAASVGDYIAIVDDDETPHHSVLHSGFSIAMFPKVPVFSHLHQNLFSALSGSSHSKGCEVLTVSYCHFDLHVPNEKAEEPEIKLPTSAGSSKKQESSRKTSLSALLTIPKPLTVWITINSGKF